MEENKNFRLPLIGIVQHGEQILNNGKKTIKEYGYFIAKSRDDNMKPYLDKFDALIKGSQKINIQFIDDNPLSIKQERSTQSGSLCYCMEGETMGKQKINNKWESVECNSSCTYLQKNENGKPLCKRVAWLKFFIPEITLNRIWLMKISSQESIENLRAHIALQKSQGNLLQGFHTLFLSKKLQTTSLGKSFYNYILDIVKQEDFLSEQTTPKSTKTVENSTENTPNVDNVEKQEKPNSSQANSTPPQEKNDTTKEKKKKSTKSNSKKTTEPENKSQEKIQDIDPYDCYSLISTFNETIVTKEGTPKEYLVGEFADPNDQICNIFINPEQALELSECDLGTFVKLDIKEISGRKFAIKLEFVQKCLKNVAA